MSGPGRSPSGPLIPRLTIVGLGLLGGSVARAARTRRAAGEIVAVGRTPGPLARARAAGVVDRATHDLAAGVAGADLVVLCAPVGALPGLVRGAWPHLAAGAILTDVGSVKAPVVAAAEACPPRAATFVGGHPMAGSERAGFDAAEAGLFEGRLTVLTPTARTPAAAIGRLTAFWEALGSHVRLLSPEAHDRAVAGISHVPHLAAYGLVASAEEEALALAATGFADTTRVAASPEALWTDIVRENREAVLAALGRYRAVLADWEALIRAGGWETLEGALARARERREKLG